MSKGPRRLRRRTGVGNHLCLAAFVAHRTARRLDAGGGIHIGEAASEERHQLAVELVDARADFAHGGAIGTGKDRHAACLGGRAPACPDGPSSLTHAPVCG